MVNRKWTDGMLATEDWWAVWLGLFMFAAGLLSYWNVDMVGWMAKTKTWEVSQVAQAFKEKGIPGVTNKLLKTSHGKKAKKEKIVRVVKDTSGNITAIVTLHKGKPKTRKVLKQIDTKTFLVQGGKNYVRVDKTFTVKNGKGFKNIYGQELQAKGKKDEKIVGKKVKAHKVWIDKDKKGNDVLILKKAQKYAWLGPFGALIFTWAVFTILTCIGAYFQKLDVKKFFFGFTCIFFITWGAWIIGHEAHFKAAKTGQSITQSQVYGTNLYCMTKVHKCTKNIKKAIKKLGVGNVIQAGLKPDASAAEIAAAKKAAEKVVKKAKKPIRLSWGLQLGGGFSYMLALAFGLIIGNFMKGFAGFLSEAAKPEWYIKVAIVYLGVKLGKMTLQHWGTVGGGLLLDMALAGAAAAFVAYLIFWPVVYTLGRKVFMLRRDASAVLSSGISICGVSAAIATAGAIRAKPILPLTVSMLIVIFAMFELLVLPGLYTWSAPNSPIVNAAAMGMTVKTDGADAAAGAILEEMMITKHYTATGERWEEGFILQGAILTKVWIDVFIGLWAFVLSAIWLYKVERKEGERVPVSEIWFRFPKFVLGYFIAWFVYVAIAFKFQSIYPDPDLYKTHTKAGMSGAKIVQGTMRKMMFMLTFVAIGAITDFSKLKGMGRLALLYAVALIAVIAPIGYFVAWLFHHGMVNKMPIVG